MKKVEFKDVLKAHETLEGVVRKTPNELLFYDSKLKFSLYLKLESFQRTGAYKFRGAYNKVARLSADDLEKGVVCASTGNHVQGVALASTLLGAKSFAFMPKSTPEIKVNKAKLFGLKERDLTLVDGDFDETCRKAKGYALAEGKTFVHPFDDVEVCAGQGTIGVELREDLGRVDYFFVPVGGAGLLAGLTAYFNGILYANGVAPTKVFAVEPEGSPTLYESHKVGEPVTLDKINDYVSAVAVRKVGDISFNTVNGAVEDYVVVPEINVAGTLVDLANNHGIVTELAGALALAGFYQEKDNLDLEGKTAVCLVTSGNLDTANIPEIMEYAKLRDFH